MNHSLLHIGSSKSVVRGRIISVHTVSCEIENHVSAGMEILEVNEASAGVVTLSSVNCWFS